MSTANAQRVVMTNNLGTHQQRPGVVFHHGQRPGNGNSQMAPRGGLGVGNASHPRNPSIVPRRGSSLGPGRKIGGNAGNGVAFASGEQVMMQRQKPQAQVQRQCQRQNNQKQQSKQQIQSADQEQEIIGGISIKEVEYNLRMLAAQQQQAKQKLEHAEQSKHDELQKQKDNNLLLEQKKYSNGEARGELDSFREFLKIATREMEKRKAGSSKLEKDLKDFQERLDGGISCGNLIDLCVERLDSILAGVKINVEETDCLVNQQDSILKKETWDYEQLKQEDEFMRTSIDNVRFEAQTLFERNKTKAANNAKIDGDMNEALSKEDDAKIELQELRDEVKANEDELAKKKAEHEAAIANLNRQEQAFLQELEALTASAIEDSKSLEDEKKAIFELLKLEGWALKFDDILNLEEFHAAKEVIEASLIANVKSREESKHCLEREIESMEQALNLLEEEGRERDEEADKLELERIAQTDAELKKKGVVAEMEAELEIEEEETNKLEEFCRELEKQIEADELKRTADEKAATAKKEGLEKKLEKLDEVSKSLDKQCRGEDQYWRDIELVGLNDRLSIARKAVDEAQEQFAISEEKRHLFNAKAKEATKKIAKILTKFPQLKALQIDYDPSKLDEEQRVFVLADLRKKFEEHKIAALSQANKPEEPDGTSTGSEDIHHRPKRDFRFYRPTQYPLNYVVQDEPFDLLPTVLFKNGCESPYPALGLSKNRRPYALSHTTGTTSATDKRVHWKDYQDGNNEDTEEDEDPLDSIRLFKESDNADVDDSGSETEKPDNTFAQPKKYPTGKSASRRSSKENIQPLVTNAPMEKYQPRRRNRKKMKSFESVKASSYFKAASGRSILEDIPQRENAREHGRQRKDQSRKIEKSKKSSETRKRTERDSSHEAVVPPKEKRLPSGADVEKRSKDSSKIVEKRAETTRKTLKDRDPEYHSKKSFKSMDEKVKEKSSHAGRDKVKTKYMNSGRDKLFEKDRSSSKSLYVRRDKHPEMEKPSTYSRNDRGTKTEKASQTGLKTAEAPLKLPTRKEKLALDDHDRKRKAKDQNPKEDVGRNKDDRRKRIKSKSSKSHDGADDVSKSSKNSKARRSRKKTGATQTSHSQNMVMDDDFGFAF